MSDAMAQPADEFAVSAARFKQAMSLLTAGVTVITSAEGDGAPCGMTATAVCSLSADPPSLLVAVNRQTRTFQAIRNSRRFAVNLLHEEQRGIADRFAAHADSPAAAAAQFLDGGLWRSRSDGVPVLQDALASFLCDVVQWSETKTHMVFFGLVRDIGTREDAGPLLYGFRDYQRLAVASVETREARA